MSLRLLQKQLGQESEERKRQLGHGPTNAARRGTQGGRGAGSARQTSQRQAGRPVDEESLGFSRSASASAATPVASASAGKGRGPTRQACDGAGIRPSIGEVDEEPEVVGDAYPSSSSAAGLGRAATAPTQVSPEGAQSSLGGVEGLGEVLARSQMFSRFGTAAAAWCEEQGAANLEEVLEALEDFAEALNLRRLEKVRFEKELRRALSEDESANAPSQRAATAVAEEEANAGGATDAARIDHEKKEKDELGRALEEALSRANLEELRAALARAEECGLTEGDEAQPVSVTAARARDCVAALEATAALLEAIECCTTEDSLSVLQSALLKAETAQAAQAVRRDTATSDSSTGSANRAEFGRSGIAEAIEQALVRLGVLKRKAESTAALKAALAEVARGGEASARAELEARLAEAQAAGVSSEVLEPALRVLQELAEASKERQEAALALEAACAEAANGKAPKLAMAITRAEAAGVRETLLLEARERLRTIEERRAACQKALKDAQAQLDVECSRPELEALASALADAECAGVTEEALVEAREAMSKAHASVTAAAQDASVTAAAALQAALNRPGRDTGALQMALQQAEAAGVDSSVLDDARKEFAKREAAEQKSRLREHAAAALQTALAARDSKALEVALPAAEKAGVSKKEVAQAKRALAAIQEEEKQEIAALEVKERRCAEAVEAVAKAADTGDVAILRAALQEAEIVGASEEALEEGRARLKPLEEEEQRLREREAALDNLKIATANGLKKDGQITLQAALDQARRLGVDRLDAKAVEQAEKTLEKWEEKARKDVATSALKAAMEDGDVDELKAALEAAEEAGVLKKTLEQARKALQQSVERKRRREEQAEAEEALRAALKKGASKEELRGALQLARRCSEGPDASRDSDGLSRLVAAAEASLAAQAAQAEAEVEKDEGFPEDGSEDGAEEEASPTDAPPYRAGGGGFYDRGTLPANHFQEVAQSQPQWRPGGFYAAQSTSAENEDQEEEEKEEQRWRPGGGGFYGRPVAGGGGFYDRGPGSTSFYSGSNMPLQEEDEEEEEEKAQEEGLRTRPGRAVQQQEEEETASAAAETASAQQPMGDAPLIQQGGEDTFCSAPSPSADPRGNPEPQKESHAADLADAGRGRGERMDGRGGRGRGRGRGAQGAGDDVAAPEALTELREALLADDAAVLGAAVARAEKEKVVDKTELASAKRALFQMQKEKREQAKREKGKQEALAILATAATADDADALERALDAAEKAGAGAAELQVAQERLREQKQRQKAETIRLALDDVMYAIGQNDVESATLALEDAAAEGAGKEDLEKAEEALAQLRERLDPEGEARRRRLEARKAKNPAKWNYAGKADNKIINDKFREHEAELERRRMLSYRGRGRFKGEAEDQGEEGQDKEVRKQLAEVSKEKGYVAPPPRNVPTKGFCFAHSPPEENEAFRHLTLRAHLEMGAGIDLHASWWGMIVDVIDEEPGQPGLRLQDVLVEVNGTSLRELQPEDAEQRFADLFGDGCVVTVEPHVELSGILNNSAGVSQESLKADLECFATDWGVELRIEERSASSLTIFLEGPQTGVKAAKPELEKLMEFYVNSAQSS